MSTAERSTNVLDPISDIPPTCLNLRSSLDPTRLKVRRAMPVGLRGHRNLRHTLAERMAARTIITSTCWEFQGSRTGSLGYVLINANGKLRGAHRVAWELANGRPIPNGLVIAHTCDNPICVNPAHLRAVTQAENLHDSIRKGRYNTWGIQKLNAAQVLEIRARAAAGERQIDIARSFGIARNTVSGIVNRKSWAHLDSPEVRS